MTNAARSSQQRAILRQIPTGATATPVVSSQLSQVVFGERVPRNEQFRQIFGASLNLDRIAACINAANMGNMRDLTDLSRETIDTDPHLSAVLNKRFGAVANFPPEVVPASGEGVDEKKARFYADVVRDQIEQIPNIAARIRDLAWGLFDGRAAQEIEWAEMRSGPATPYGRVRWVVRNLHWIHPRRLSFGPERELRVVDQIVATGFNEAGRALRDVAGGWKFIQFTPRLFGEYPEREGIGRRVLYWSFFKRFGARERMILLELFAKPWRWLEVKDEALKAGGIPPDEGELANLFIKAIAGSGYGRAPRGFEMKTEQPQRQAGNIHQEAIEESDRQLSKLVLGQTGTTDGQAMGLNSSQALVMSNEQLMIAIGDAGAVSEALEDGLTDPIIALNFGLSELDHAPHLRLRADIRNRIQELERLDKALRSGLAIKKSEAYELSGFEEPSDEDPVVVMQAPEGGGAFGGGGEPRPVIIYPRGRSPEPGELPPEPSKAGDEGEGDELPESSPPRGGSAGPAVPVPGEGGEPEASPEGQPEAPSPGNGQAPEPRRATRPGAGNEGVRLAPPRGGESRAVLLCEGALDAEAADRLLRGAEPSVAAALLATLGEGVRADRRPALEKYGEAVCCAQQPESVNGSPEVIVERMVREVARLAERMGGRVIDAAEGLGEGGAIFRALRRAAEDLDLSELSRAVERRIVHAEMLGALDHFYEREEGVEIAPEPFERPAGEGVRLADKEPSFASKAFGVALRFFKSKRVLRKEEFERLTNGAKRRAFTVAGLARDDLLRAAHEELARSIAEGRDLRKFQQFARDRLESAGWTPANPSHVETVARTNVVQAQAVGRLVDMNQPEVRRARPFWQIRTVGDSRRRVNHGRVNGWVLRAEDPFFDRAFPGAFGYNCRCRATSLSERQVSSRGLVIRSGAEIRDLPDRGFSGSGVRGLLSQFA